MKFSDEQIEQLNTMFDKKLKPVKEEMKTHLEKQLKPLKKDIASIKKDLNWVIGKYDTRLIHLEKHTIHPPHRIDF